MGRSREGCVFSRSQPAVLYLRRTCIYAYLYISLIPWSLWTIERTQEYEYTSTSVDKDSHKARSASGPAGAAISIRGGKLRDSRNAARACVATARYPSSYRSRSLPREFRSIDRFYPTKLAQFHRSMDLCIHRESVTCVSLLVGRVSVVGPLFEITKGRVESNRMESNRMETRRDATRRDVLSMSPFSSFARSLGSGLVPYVVPAAVSRLAGSRQRLH